MPLPPSGSNLLPATNVKITANVQSENKSDIVGEKSLKSERTYQVGIIYKDIYGRETPVFTNSEASFTVDKSFCDQKNSIITNLENVVPQWVDTYKFFVKETSNEYYNVCMDRWYDSEDENIWLSFPSAERNKLQEDNFIILKKKADEDGILAAVKEDAKYKIIDISNEAPDDIKTDYELYGSATLEVETNSAVPGASNLQFDLTGGSYPWQGSIFYDTLYDNDTGAGPMTNSAGFIGWPLEDVVIKLSKADGENTGWLDVANIYKATELHIQLSKPILGSAGDENSDIKSIMGGSDEGPITVKLAKRVVKKKPEFDGRFFVKIRRDGIVNDYIRSVGNPNPSFVVKDTMKQYALNYFSSDFDKFLTDDIGERWYIDDCDRGLVGSGGGNGSKGPYPEDDGFGLKGDGSSGRSSSDKSSLRCTMELSLNYIKDASNMGFSTANNATENKDFLATMSTTNTLFRWKEDPFQHVYKVTTVYNSEDGSTNGRGILNFSSKKWGKKAYRNKTIRLYLKFKTTGWRLNDDQGASGTYAYYPDEKDKSPFGYQNTASNGYTPDNSVSSTTVVAAANTWNPTRKGYGTYGGSAANQLTSQAWDQMVQSGPQGAALFDNSAGNYNTIEIIDISDGDANPVFTKNPAIWETEPREDVGLDIYYEASQAYPVRLGHMTNELFAPYGCVVTCTDAINNKSFYLPENTTLYDWAPTGHGGDTILLYAKVNTVGIINNNAILSSTNPELITPGSIIMSQLNPTSTTNGYAGLELQFTRIDGSYTTAKIKSYGAWSTSSPPNSYHIDGTHPVYPGTGLEWVLIKLDRDLTNSKIKLPYFNCYTFGNGVESDRIRDDFNAVKIGKGVKASTVLPGVYRQEQRTNGLIYSGIYNSNSNTNNLNQFIGAEKITKDVPPSYGSIQKLKARDTNLVAFCEDKILKIVAYKDALYSADGKPQLIASNNVLGDITSFAGEFGISKNPESYAEDNFRMYFTDKQRGKVLRLSGDGITPISSVGMQDYFADKLKLNDTLIGTFDDRKQEYNLTLKEQQKTLSFSEAAKGWTSFKSFIPEDGLSINNNYYTFSSGKLWKHHDNNTRNNFYGNDHNSLVDILFNEESAKVKSFASMKYEGTQGKITQNLGSTVNGVSYKDDEYYNNIGKLGWYVESGITDLQEAGEMEFKSKEGKWFSYMKGKPVEGAGDLDSKEFSFQGIALLDSIVDNGGEDSEGSEGTNLFTLTLKDLGDQDGSTPNNYTVSEYIESGITPGDDIGWNAGGLTDPNNIPRRFVITPDSGHTVTAGDFGISGITWGSVMGPMNPTNSPGVILPTGIAAVFFADSDLHPTNGLGTASTLAFTSTNPSINNEVIVVVSLLPGFTMPNNDLTLEIDIDGLTNPEIISSPTKFLITVRDVGDED